MIDLNSHGTHVAGTIGAQGNNGIGVPGVAHDVAIMPVRIMNNSGSFYDNLEGIDYAVAMGSHISNHSYSYGAYFLEVLIFQVMFSKEFYKLIYQFFAPSYEEINILKLS